MMEQEPQNQDLGSRLQPGTLWMAGAVVAGCALLGFSLLDDSWQEAAEREPAPVVEPVMPEVSTNQTISLRVGQQWTAILESRAGTGYSWQLAEELPAGSPVSVTLSGVEHDESNCCGFPVPVTLTITAQKPGTAEVHLVYVRPWEKDMPPAKQEAYRVTVSAASAP
ncbi:MAG: hypothetical protein E7032_09885 [Akkermansiaceae bacterium]|nr:hypothetical protein [Akkermansiaceae bacterium]